jgi:hypothetical protein
MTIFGLSLRESIGLSPLVLFQLSWLRQSGSNGDSPQAPWQLDSEMTVEADALRPHKEDAKLRRLIVTPYFIYMLKTQASITSLL